MTRSPARVALPQSANESGAEVRKCVYCGGTGIVFTMKSWFASDGLSRQKCSLCAGSGRCNYAPGPEATSAQKQLRERAAIKGDAQ